MSNNHPSEDPIDTIFLAEIFSAIQGEGLFVGHRQVFVRLNGCNIRCSYCDQPESLELRGGSCRIELDPGVRNWEIHQNPVDIIKAAELTVSLSKMIPHHSVSITGGEPLMQAGRLAIFLPILKSQGLRVHLETNGTLVKAVARVLDWIDVVSLDIKLDSADGQQIDLSIHEQFLAKAAQATTPPLIYEKIVIGSSTTSVELCEAVSMIRTIDPKATIFLQPVTPFGTVTTAPSPEQLLTLQAEALNVHPDIRVVPQTHKMIGQL